MDDARPLAPGLGRGAGGGRRPANRDAPQGGVLPMAETPPPNEAINEAFVTELTRRQNQLLAYIVTLLGDADRARDVLQQTNIVMWRKAAEYTPGTSFAAWACKIAYFEVLSERRKMRRERLVFDDDMLECVGREAAAALEDYDNRAEALKDCLESLPPARRRQICERYQPGGSVKAIARSLGQTPGAVSTALYRTRSMLQDCIERKLGAATNPT